MCSALSSVMNLAPNWLATPSARAPISTIVAATVARISGGCCCRDLRLQANSSIAVLTSVLNAPGRVLLINASNEWMLFKASIWLYSPISIEPRVAVSNVMANGLNDSTVSLVLLFA